MSEVLTISLNDVVREIKLSCQFPTLIEKIAARQIIIRTAQAQGIKAEPEELQQAANSLRLTSNLRSAEATWLWLQKHSLSLDDFEELANLNVISSKLAHHLFAERVEPLFVERQLDYTKAVIYEIVLNDKDLAMELFYAMEEGERNFHEIAHRYIQTPELRRLGGYRGTLSRNELKPEISAAVFAANPPQILKPIVSSKGAHLILVEELIPPQLDRMLRYQIMGELFSIWLKTQIDGVKTITQLESCDLGSYVAKTY